MAKQTFTTGQVLTAAQMTSLQQTAMLGGAASAKTANYTLVAADAGTAISMSNAGATTITVNTGLFAAGDTVQITNIGAGVCTITAGTATVNTASSLALAQYESGTLYFTSASAAIFIKGAGAAAGGGGKVLQVVSATYATTTTIATETYTDTGLTASITPSSAASKVLVLISQIGYNQRNGTESGMAVRLVRGSTTIRTCGPNGYEAGYFIGATANPVGVANIINLSHLDSPSTTSSTTYKTQGVVYSTSGSGTSNFNSNNSTSSIILLEIGA